MITITEGKLKVDLKNSSRTLSVHSIFGEPQRVTKKEKCANKYNDLHKRWVNTEGTIIVPIQLLERWVKVGVEHQKLKKENGELQSTMFKLRAVLHGLTD